MIFYLVTGITLGLSSGISPGPLFTLVISETLNYGRKEGIKVAITPLITDIPIVAISFFIIDQFANSDVVYGLLSLGGGLFIGFLAIGSFRMKKFDMPDNVRTRSIRKGVVTNLLNPAPYIFWITVGIPTVLKGFNQSLVHALLFVIPFYLLLVGSKIVLAIMISKTGSINPKVMRYINIILGIVLLALAVKFVYDGMGYLI